MRTTSYISHNFAKVGRVLRLKDDNVGWVDGWVPSGTASTAHEPQHAIASRRFHVAQSLRDVESDRLGEANLRGHDIAMIDYVDVLAG